MDDQTLLSQYVATGDASAFAELTHRYSALVRGICFRLLGNTHDAEEVTQECFFELARHARTLDMQAAPYDLLPLGYEPIAIETPSGRAEYVKRQRELMELSAPLRQRVVAALGQALMAIDSLTTQNSSPHRSSQT